MILFVITMILAIVSTNARLFKEGNGAQIMYKWTRLDYQLGNGFKMASLFEFITTSFNVEGTPCRHLGTLT
jgi:hypothetical protein